MTLDQYFKQSRPRGSNSERSNKLRKVASKTTGLLADYYLPAEAKAWTGRSSD